MASARPQIDTTVALRDIPRPEDAPDLKLEYA
jgi:hypothetical protein